MKFIIRPILVLALLSLLFFNNYLIRAKNLILKYLTAAREREYPAISSELNFKSESVEKNGLIYQSAKIHLTYPFNNRNLFTINLGTENGIEKSMAAAAGPGALFGKVIEVFPNFSLVRTIFDSDFKTMVRIGSNEVGGLLEGGNAPIITMIDKDSKIKTGDIIYSAGADFPYGMKIGKVSGILDATKEYFFKKAAVAIEYNPNDLTTILIITNYKPSLK